MSYKSTYTSDKWWQKKKTGDSDLFCGPLEVNRAGMEDVKYLYIKEILHTRKFLYLFLKPISILSLPPFIEFIKSKYGICMSTNTCFK